MNDLPTLYRLADGTQGDPGECSADDKGVLRHKNGMPVVIDSDGKPVEIKREAEVNMTAKAADAGKDADEKAKAANEGPKPVTDGRAPLDPALTAPAGEAKAAAAATVDPKPAAENKKIETR